MFKRLRRLQGKNLKPTKIIRKINKQSINKPDEETNNFKFIEVKMDLCNNYDIVTLRDPYKSVYDYFKKFKDTCYLVHEDPSLYHYTVAEAGTIDMSNIVGYIRDIDIENKTCTVDFPYLFEEYANPKKYRITFSGILNNNETVYVTKLCLIDK